MVSLAGLEPAAHSLEGCCSIQLSYRPIKRMATYKVAITMERVMGIEPT